MDILTKSQENRRSQIGSGAQMTGKVRVDRIWTVGRLVLRRRNDRFHSPPPYGKRGRRVDILEGTFLATKVRKG
eukprot:SAG11_NODE_37730_length_255_cov_1.044872_1_plen_73_part_10